jgi:hypothetical protein
VDAIMGNVFPTHQAPTVCVEDILEPGGPHSMALTKLKNNTDGARAADADAAPLENPQKRPRAAAPLIAREIHTVTAGHWTFSKNDMPEGWTLYTSWEGASITLNDLHAAMTSLEEDPSTPDLPPVNLAP